MVAQREQRHAVGLPGVVLVLLGAALVLIAIRFLDWYAVTSSGADTVASIRFSDLHQSAEQLGGAGVASAYFGWLAWTLLIAMIVIGTPANLAVHGVDVLRAAGFLVGLIGVGGTYYALAQHSNATGGQDVFAHATWGIWLAPAGYASGAVGAVIGARPRRETREATG